MASASAGLSIHVVDIAEGRPAAGLRVDLSRLDPDGGRTKLLENQRLDADGKASLSGGIIDRGRYEAVFRVSDYYDELGRDLPEAPFLDLVPLRFGIDDPARHHHLPLKLTPWGFSLFLTR